MGVDDISITLHLEYSTAANLVLGGVAGDALGVGEGDVGGRGAVALVAW